MFLNNFVLVADLLDKNIKMGSLVVFSLIVTAAALLQELYRLKDNSCVVPDKRHLGQGLRRSAAGLRLLAADLCQPVVVCG